LSVVNFDGQIQTSKSSVTFISILFIKMVFTLEQDIFIGMAYFRTGNFDAANGWQYSTDDAFHQFQQMFPEPVVTLVAFRQHCMRLVERYLHTGDVKKAKPTGRTSTLTEDVVENVRGRMEQSPRKSVRKLSLQTGVILIQNTHYPKFFVGHIYCRA
jgi:hypothetical protein